MTLAGASNRLILALDVPAQEKAMELVQSLKRYVAYFKVGLQLFTAAGPGIVARIRGQGARVFLDLKFHDIPNTVAPTAVEAARSGAEMMTLHTLGGEEMMRRTRQLLAEHSEREGWPVPKLLGVTILTSIGPDTLPSLGFMDPLEKQVLRLAGFACKAGLDGVVCSPLELKALRNSGLPPEFLLVTPGIRPDHTAADDQARTMTPGEAIASGASYLVVGRPVLAAPDPVKAVREILDEIEAGLNRRKRSGD